MVVYVVNNISNLNYGEVYMITVRHDYPHGLWVKDAGGSQIPGLFQSDMI